MSLRIPQKVTRNVDPQMVARMEALADLEEKGRVFLAAKERAKGLVAETEELKPKIIKIVQDIGATDEKGSRSVSTPTLEIQYQKRASTELNEERATEFLKRKGLASQVIKTRTEEYIDNEELLRLVARGIVSDAEMRALMDESESWALVVSRKKVAK